METCRHDGIEEGVGEGNDCHPLVMGHERLDNGHAFSLGNARQGVIQRFIKAVSPLASRSLETPEIFDGGAWLCHCSERGGVGCNDGIVAESAFETQSRDAEI